MTNLIKILNKLRNKSNIDYEYYHLFGNNKLELSYETHDFTINYILYIINSDFMRFFNDYKKFQHESITDVFLERIDLSLDEKDLFFQMIFKNLFWLKLNEFKINEEDYKKLGNFLQRNSRDINRIFLENLNLNDNFLKTLYTVSGFETLKFINFDNNNISNYGLQGLVSFLQRNKILLEYLSVVGNKITSIEEIINNDSQFQHLRILDVSGNHLKEIEIIEIIYNFGNLQELYCKNINFSDSGLEKIIAYFEKHETSIFHVRLTLNGAQKEYYNDFKNIGENKNIYFDINFETTEDKIYTTFYIKGSDNNKLQGIQSDTFSVIKSESDFNNMLSTREVHLRSAINLFLFDFHDYKKINYLLDNFGCNYIYIENYFISDDDFVYFIELIRNKKPKHYKINFISIEISEFQLNYLIENFPENITYIEINLNKILQNREKYIVQMLKNKSFIFENMELYQKIFK